MRYSTVVLVASVALTACGDEPRELPRTDALTAEAAGTESASLPISASEATDSLPAVGAEEARRVIEEYYDAIAAEDYLRAYSMWGDSGRASGQTYEEYVDGYAETARVAVSVGEAGKVEGAAGSRYVEVPVVVEAVTTAGEPQRFEGSYTLRRAVVEGASAEEWRWHLYDGRLRAVR